MTPTEPTRSVGGPVAALRRAVTAPVRLQTYKNLLYLALAFPLGLAYFVGFVSGTALGVGLIITLVGLPILGATLAASTLVAGLEARLATRLVGVEASVPAFLREFEMRDGIVAPGDGFVAAVKHLVTAPSTWTSVVLVLSKFAFGLVSFVALVTTGTLGAALIATPFLYRNPEWTAGLGSEVSISHLTVGPWVVDTLPEALGVAAGGVVFVVVALNALNALARLHATYTAALLRVDDESA